MFRGQFLHSVDQKGRTSMPVRFRAAVMADGAQRVVVTKAPFDPCLHVYPFRAWVAYEAKISELPSHDPNIVRFRRTYSSPALEVEIDKAGRLRLSAEFREQAQLSQEVLWAGMGKIIELWSRERWDEAVSMAEADAASYRDTIGALI